MTFELVVRVVRARRALAVLLKCLLHELVVMRYAKLLVRGVGRRHHNLVAARVAPLALVLVHNGLHAFLGAAAD